MERYYDLIDQRKKNIEPPQLSKEEIERQDALMAARLLKSSLRGPVTRGHKKSKSKKEKSDKPKRSSTNNAFNRDWYLSVDLQNVLGTALLPRPQIVKQLWVYIKDKKLQNPQDGRQILCDDKLEKVFKKSMYIFHISFPIIFQLNY